MMSHFDLIMTRVITMCLKTCQIEKGDVHYHSQTDLGTLPALMNHSDPYVHGEQEDY